MILRIIIIGLVLYFAYRFVFHFLIPVSKAAADMRQKINAFQNQVHEEQNTFKNRQKSEPQPQAKAGDYIDYEEVK
jgi:phosphotransferase system  glucose/maltose/N-acetylglucosamine-specific IIC component